MTLKAIKTRIYPNREQQLKIKLNFGYNRFVWNQMLNMLIERYKNNPEAKFLNSFALNNLLPALKTEYNWLKNAESQSLQCTNHDLIEAYKRFFKEHTLDIRQWTCPSCGTHHDRDINAARNILKATA